VRLLLDRGRMVRTVNGTLVLLMRFDEPAAIAEDSRMS
jgi:hypothetical protein